MHTWPAKEGLALLGVCVSIGVGRLEEREVIPKRWQLLEEWTGEKPETESNTKPGINLRAQHPPKWPQEYGVSTPITETSFPNVLIPRREWVSCGSNAFHSPKSTSEFRVGISVI